MSIVSIILVQTYDDVAFGHTFQSAWACHDLLEVLCQLSERGHVSFVRSILGNPLSYCPEVLPLGMAHVNGISPTPHSRETRRRCACWRKREMRSGCKR
ncbi:hypothetical protein ACS0TY_014242 [Phlomoides rotata]